MKYKNRKIRKKDIDRTFSAYYTRKLEDCPKATFNMEQILVSDNSEDIQEKGKSGKRISGIIVKAAGFAAVLFISTAAFVYSASNPSPAVRAAVRFSKQYDLMNLIPAGLEDINYIVHKGLNPTDSPGGKQ